MDHWFGGDEFGDVTGSELEGFQFFFGGEDGVGVSLLFARGRRLVSWLWSLLFPADGMRLDGGNLIRSWEFEWDGQGDFTRCDILNGAGENGLKAYAVQAVPICLPPPKVSHGSDDDPPLAIFDLVGNGFVRTRSSLFLTRIGSG